MGRKHISLIVICGTPDEDLPTEEAGQSHKPLAQSPSRSSKDQGT